MHKWEKWPCTNKQNGCHFSCIETVRNGPINSKSALVHKMAWCWIGNKPFSEPVIAQFTDPHIESLVQDFSNSIADTLKLLKSCTKPSICIIQPRIIGVVTNTQVIRGFISWWSCLVKCWKINSFHSLPYLGITVSTSYFVGESSTFYAELGF